MGSRVKGLAVAAAFLTRIPIPVEVSSDDELGGAVPWFPVVGAGIGAVVGAVAWVGLGVELPPLVAAGVAVAASLLLTGAFHEDGLADTFDGLGSGRSDSEAVEIMRDSRIGAFGAAALTVALLLQAATLAAIPQRELITMMTAAHAASRSLAVIAMLLPAGAHSGLGADYARTAHPVGITIGAAGGLGIAAALLLADGWIMLPAVATGAAVALWARHRIGGVTGDVLGAVQQVTMLTILVGGSSLTS
jgi:adenosylcobinamide-GDP ribazoletransferase